MGVPEEGVPVGFRRGSNGKKKNGKRKDPTAADLLSKQIVRYTCATLVTIICARTNSPFRRRVEIIIINVARFDLFFFYAVTLFFYSSVILTIQSTLMTCVCVQYWSFGIL